MSAAHKSPSTTEIDSTDFLAEMDQQHLSDGDEEATRMYIAPAIVAQNDGTQVMVKAPVVAAPAPVVAPDSAAALAGGWTASSPHPKRVLAATQVNRIPPARRSTKVFAAAGMFLAATLTAGGAVYGASLLGGAPAQHAAAAPSVARAPVSAQQPVAAKPEAVSAAATPAPEPKAEVAVAPAPGIATVESLREEVEASKPQTAAPAVKSVKTSKPVAVVHHPKAAAPVRVAPVAKAPVRAPAKAASASKSAVGGLGLDDAL